MTQSTDTLRALYEAISRGDFDGIVQYLHPEVEIHPAVGGELDFTSTYRGRDGMRQFMETALRGFDVAVEPEQLITAPGDRILAIEPWQLRGRDGVEGGLQLADVYAFRDGLTVRIRMSFGPRFALVPGDNQRPFHEVPDDRDPPAEAFRRKTDAAV